MARTGSALLQPNQENIRFLPQTGYANRMVFAMAGLAEAAVFYGLLIVGGILLVAAGLLALAWWKQSAMTATIAFVLVILDGLLLQPWSAFAPSISDDPDEASWLVRLRIASVIWGLFVVIAASCLAMIIRRRRFSTNEINVNHPAERAPK